jgi:ABC-type multidrug transport system fused ATPase/permease subunit
MSQILVELVKLANLVVTLNKAMASANRISAVFDINTSMREGDGVDFDTDPDDDVLETESDAGSEAVSFRDVSFAYPGSSEDSLENISFVVNKGQTVGIIGGTGSGKSTIASLIARFYDVTGGGVYLFGHDIKDYSYDQLHSLVGTVMQKAVLFSGTIESNIRMAAGDVSEDVIYDAVKKAQADEIVKGKGGIKACVEQGGRNFSGGQKQRISIARTLAMRTPIVILDDSSSALDYATDLSLRRALKELPEDTTVFIISQRTSSIQHADKIIVLEDGRMEGIGTHEELLKSCDLYKEIHESQLHRS